MNGAILNLAGPGQKISGIMPCTVIRPGDMADQILDRDKHPAWQGERTRLVYVFPANEKLWDKYAQIRADSFRNDGDGHEATEFYGKHRKEMVAPIPTSNVPSSPCARCRRRSPAPRRARGLKARSTPVWRI